MHGSVADAAAAVRASLGAIPGVEGVLIDAERPAVWLRIDPYVGHVRIMQDATDRLRGLGYPDVPLEAAVVASRRERRVRFDSAQRVANPDRSVSVRVTLEWDGALHTAEATGEGGETIELRTAAQAALSAVEQVTGEPLNLRLVGVKHVRAFDGELVVVSIYGGPGKKTLLGVVLAGSDPFRATAVAVLMALNRVLGNYLVTH